MSSEEGDKEKKVRLPKWRPQGPHAAAVARAYWEGKLDLSIEKYRTFLDQNQSLAQHYGVNLQKGRRNLRANIRRLINRIQLWEHHRVDPKTGNHVKFSPSFLKRGNFPPRPETVDDVPPEQLEAFQPGRDDDYEEAIREEREEDQSETETLPPVLTKDPEASSVESENGDNSFNRELPDYHSDTSINDKIIHNENTNKEPNDIDIENKSVNSFPNKKSVRFIDSPPKIIMTEQSAKLIGSTTQLEPVFAQMKGNDPDWERYGEYHSRDILLIRFLIPDGFEETSLKTRVSNGGTVLNVTASMILSKFDSKYTIGKALREGPNGQKIMVALASELTTIYTDLPRTGEGTIEKKWKIELPVAVERDSRNPNANWNRCRPGAKGFVSVCGDSRSIFCFMFFFAKEKEGRANPRDQTGSFMDVSHEEYETRLGLAHMSISRQQQRGEMFQARYNNMSGKTGKVNSENRGNGDSYSYDEETIGDVSMTTPLRSRRSRRSSTAWRSNVQPGMDINLNRPINANNYIPNPPSSQYDPRRSAAGIVDDVLFR